MVSKHWAALISDPDFVVGFIAQKKDETYGILMRYSLDNDVQHGLRLNDNHYFRPFVLDIHNFTSSPLEQPDPTLTVVASSQDLLLYCRNNKAASKYDFCISNVQTRQCIALPTPPFYYVTPNDIIQCGLITHQSFTFHNQSIVDVIYHYSVVVVYSERGGGCTMRAHLFSRSSSNNNNSNNNPHCGWSNKTLSLAVTCRMLANGPALYFDGRLCFSCRQGMFGFECDDIVGDKEVVECHFIAWPVRTRDPRFGLLKGASIIAATFDRNSSFQVWILEDYWGAKWSLLHTVTTTEWVSTQPSMLETFHKLLSQSLFRQLDVFGLHPHRPDLVYLIFHPGRVFLCNLTTKSIDSDCRIITARRWPCVHHLWAAPLIFPSWPTPLPHLVVPHLESPP